MAKRRNQEIKKVGIKKKERMSMGRKMTGRTVK